MKQIKDCELYVGNLSTEVNENDLRPLFERFGKVTTIKVARDPTLQRSKGYAIVEMGARSDDGLWIE
jgi:RNA recognition motif-containing protein